MKVKKVKRIGVKLGKVTRTPIKYGVKGVRGYWAWQDRIQEAQYQRNMKRIKYEQAKLKLAKLQRSNRKKKRNAWDIGGFDYDI